MRFGGANSRRVAAVLGWTLMLSGCGGEAGSPVSCPQGQERCPCPLYAPCAPGLICLSALCVRPAAIDAATVGPQPDRMPGSEPDGGPDAPSSPDVVANRPVSDAAQRVADVATPDTPAPLPCPPGTVAAGAICATPGPLSFTVRIGSTEIPADGYSRVPVLVLATAADGSPALERVALSLTRPEAGVFDRKELNLTRVGGPTYFIPCTSATPGCLGSVRVQVAMASAPNAILATSDSLQLVAPTGVGSAAACLSGGNVMVLDGNNSIYGGLLTVTDAVFSATGSGPSDVQISVNPRDPTQGLIWRLWFSSRELGQPILEQVYRSAMGAAAPSPSHPGLDVSGEVGGTPKSCFGISGEFEVQRLIWVGNRLKEATVTFVERCRSDAPDSSLRGCIHIEQ